MRPDVRPVGRWAVVGVMAVALGGLAGCARGGGLTTHPVKGRVVAPGGQAWAGGTVTFRSVRDPGTLATGEIQKDGTFALVSHYLEDGQPRSQPGAAAGEYTVEVAAVGGARDRDGVPSNPPVKVARTYTVQPGENDFVIEARMPAGR